MNQKSKTFEDLLSGLKEEEVQIKEITLSDIKKQSAGFKKALLIRNIEELVLLPMFIIASFLYALSKDNFLSMIFPFTIILGLIIVQVLVYLNYKKTNKLSYDLSVEEYSLFEKTHMMERLSVLKKIRFVFYGLFPLASVGDRFYTLISLEYIKSSDWFVSGVYFITLLVIVFTLFYLLEKKIRDLKFELEQIS